MLSKLMRINNVTFDRSKVDEYYKRLIDRINILFGKCDDHIAPEHLESIEKNVCRQIAVEMGLRSEYPAVEVPKAKEPMEEKNDMTVAKSNNEITVKHIDSYKAIRNAHVLWTFEDEKTADMFAEVIRRAHKNESISSLFQTK